MEPYQLFATLAAIGYAVAAIFSKQALSKGVGVLRMSFIINWVFFFIFTLLLIEHTEPVPWEKLYQPLVAGIFVFLAQICTVAAIRVGDVSLQTPMMGTKALFATIIAVVSGTESIGLPIFFAALISMLGIGLLGFSAIKSERFGLSISMVLLSSFLFAVTDTIVGAFASGFGVPAFLFITMLVNALLSFGLMPFFDASLRKIPKAAWPWLIFSCVLMGGQALLLNYTLGSYQHVPEINILYSTRGLWSVIFAAIAIHLFKKNSDTKQGKIIFLRFAGALLMCVAIGILFLS
jgi:drug/metabolite transporter (DMT)-like permease